MRGSQSKQTIFQEDWWLEAAGGEALRKIRVVWNGEEVAALHFVEENRFGLKLIKMPPFTRTGGPRLAVREEEGAARARDVRRATSELIALLPKCAGFKQIFDPNDETASSFALEGYTVACSYTSRTDRHTSPEDVWMALSPLRRKRLSACKHTLQTQIDHELSRFKALAGREYSKSETMYDFDAIRRIFEAARLRQRTCILTALDCSGEDVCSAILVWDCSNLYFWLATRDHERAARGAKTLLVWEAIKMAHQKGLSFDFDSHASLAGFRFMASFGLPLIARPLVLKANLPLRLAFGLRSEWIHSNLR